MSLELELSLVTVITPHLGPLVTELFSVELDQHYEADYEEEEEND